MEGTLKNYKYYALTVIFFLLAGCGEKAAPLEEKAEETKRLPKVRVVEAAHSLFVKKIETIGVCKANRVVRVSTEEAGVVKRIAFDKGDKVKKGKFLLALDDSNLKAALDELEAAFNMESLNYEKLLALKEGRGAVSEFDFKNAALKKQMAAARAEAIRVRLKKMSLSSPIKGTVEKKFVEAGEFLSPGAMIAEIIDTSTVKIEAGIAEKETAFFRKGTEAEVVFDAYPDKTFKGRIDYVSAEVDEMSGTFTVEIGLKNKKGLFKPGMMTRVRLEKERCETCILLPQDAILDADGGRAIFIIDGEGHAVLRPVVTGESNGGRIVIESGVEAGERVVVVGNKGIVDGESVEVIE